MSRRAIAYVVTLLVGSLALAVPRLGLAAGSGGGGVNGSGGGSTSSDSSQSNEMGKVHPGNSVVTASGNGITISSRVSGFLGHDMRFSGSVPSAGANQRVEIERLGKETGGSWRPTAHAYARGNGSFAVVWHVNHTGRFRFRAVLEPSHGGHTASPYVTATLFQYSLATEYGQGFWGSKTACGETLHHNTLGTANRTLPCGTHVEIYYHGRTIIVAVIDRGPYANGADWDLTLATDQALGVPGTAEIGAASVPSH